MMHPMSHGDTHMSNSKETGADTLTKNELIERAKTDKRLARELRSYGSTTYGAEMLASWAPFWNRADLRRVPSSEGRSND